MGSYRQTFLYNFSTLVTFLTGETWVHSNHLMTSSCSLIFKDIEECTPRGVENALGQMVIFHHIGDLKVFHGNTVILFSIPLRSLEMVISALAIDLQMRLGDVPGGNASSVAAFLASAHRTLFASERLLGRTIETRVRNHIALAIGKEDFQPDINADVRMLTGTWCVFVLWLCFADNQRVPMPIGAVNQVHRLGGTHDRPVQLDLEEMPHLLRDNEVFLILMQIAIFAILPKLDGMPPIWLLETRETNTGDVVLLGGKKAFEGLREAICEHLYRGGWYVLTLSFECRFKLIFAWECPVLLIPYLDGLKHAIVHGARLCQARHELAGLLLIHEQAVLKYSHENILPQVIRIVKRFVPAGGFSPPCIHAWALKPHKVEASHSSAAN